MKKAVKIWLITAAVLVVVGIGLMTAALAAVNFDITKLGTVPYENNTYKVTGKFDQISIEDSTTDIEFALSDNKQCSVVCNEPEHLTHTASVQNGVLTITAVDERQWYEYISLTFESPKMTVYLPEKEYAALTVSSHTGNITLSKDFTFSSIDIRCDTGNVECYSSVKETVGIELATGNIFLENTAPEKIALSTSTGNVKLDSVNAKRDIDIKTNTGNIRLTDTLAKGSLHLETDTGNVTFDGCDAASLDVKTDTGNIKGTLLSAKRFSAHSDTGRINVPNTYSGGECDLKTDTGNIDIELV